MKKYHDIACIWKIEDAIAWENWALSFASISSLMFNEKSY